MNVHLESAPTAAAGSGRWRELRDAAGKRAPVGLLGKILYLEHVTVSFDGFKALNGLTLYLDPGELRCIIGPNGAGKTTMMDVITGKTRPDAGAAWFGQSVDLLKLTEPEIAQAGIGRKFQKPTVFEPLTVFENLELALAGPRSFWKMLVRAADAAGSRADRRGARDHRADTATQRRRRRAVARPEAVAGDRHAADAGVRSCCWSTSRSPA